jgi:hypothetical protein
VVRESLEGDSAYEGQYAGVVERNRRSNVRMPPDNALSHMR